MKPIIILYQPEEDELCALYEQGYRIAGVTFVVGIGTKVYMQMHDLNEAAHRNLHALRNGNWRRSGELDPAGIAELYPAFIEEERRGDEIYYRIKDEIKPDIIS